MPTFFFEVQRSQLLPPPVSLFSPAEKIHALQLIGRSYHNLSDNLNSFERYLMFRSKLFIFIFKFILPQYSPILSRKENMTPSAGCY